MDITGLGQVWRKIIQRKPAVPKTAPVDSEGVMSGSDNDSREESDYSQKKKSEAEAYRSYGPDGKTHGLNDDGKHIKVDEIS